MNWKILNVSIPVKNIKKSIKFYEMLLGKSVCTDDVMKNIFENDEDYFFGKKGFGLRLFKPKQDLCLERKLQSRRSFVTILVDGLEKIKESLNANQISFLYNEFNGLKKIQVQEPSLNLIQFVENNNQFNTDYDGFDFGLDWGIHHMNLESLNVRESVNFFSNIVGFNEGKWKAPKNKGDFSIDPKELSIFPTSKDNKGLHIIKPDDGFGYRNNFAHNPSIAGHPAFTIKNLSELIKKLQKRKILFSDAKVYAMPGFHQIYLYDNNANMLEINQSV